MASTRGVISLVQEGRFRLVTDGGQVLPFVLSHRAAAEPQDLPPLMRSGTRVRVDYSEARHLISGVAHRIVTEDQRR
jgi:hypothetical protein